MGAVSSAGLLIGGQPPPGVIEPAGMRAAGRSYNYIFLLWSAIAIGAALAIAAGYVGFGSLGAVWPPRLKAFGAGALLAMTAETMIPEAFHKSAFFRLARRLRFRSASARRRDDALVVLVWPTGDASGRP